MRKIFTFLLALVASVGMSFADPVSPVTAARFLYTYDCQRNPAYPKQGSPCTLRGFSDPYVGYKGIGSDAKNTPFGPWKLEFAAYYTPSNDYGCQRVVTQAVNQYYSSLSSQEKEAKRLEVPIFRLWQYNIVAGEYQHASYGIVCAYADEGNAEDHGALFISSEGNGCFLAGKPHKEQISLSCENDLTTGMNNLVTAASATDPDYDAYMPVILSIDAIGTVELTQHCKDFIEGSSSAYNALTDAQKGQVTNYQVLVDAKNQWAPLVAEAKPYADAVVDLINAIPNPIVYTQSCKNKIDAAQNAYDALTSGQKIFVSNYETLKNAPSDLLKAAPYVHILFKANGKEKKFENVTLPHEFTEAEMKTMLKEMYSVEGDYDMFAYTDADAVNISGGKWTISPFMGKVDVNGDLNKFDPETGDMDMISISLEITLDLPPYEPDPTYTVALADGTANADKVTLSATSVEEGATVTVTPNEEYEITDFSAYYVVVDGQLGTINPIDATLNPETGAYSFTMPAHDVTIETTIALKPAPATPTVYNSGSVALSNLKVGDILMAGVTLTDDSNSKVKFVPSRLKLMGNIRKSELTVANFVSSLQTPLLGENAAMTFQGGAITITPIDEEGKDGNAWVVTEIFVEADIPVTLAGITYSGTEPDPATPTVWTALKVGDVIKVGDQIEVPAEGDGSWGINGNVLRNTWGPYTLIRADIVQEYEWDDPVVTETEDGAYYVFKAENSDFYPLSNLGKGTGLVVTGTSDGLVVTAAENKEFTVAVHENGSAPTAVENVQTNEVQASKLMENGVLYILHNGVKYNVQGARVR